MVLPRIKFLNLIVVLAAPRACFMILKLKTLYGSLSISTVNPFLMSDVSMATWRVVLDGVVVAMKDGGTTKAVVVANDAISAARMMMMDRNVIMID